MTREPAIKILREADIGYSITEAQDNNHVASKKSCHPWTDSVWDESVVFHHSDLPVCHTPFNIFWLNTWFGLS